MNPRYRGRAGKARGGFRQRFPASLKLGHNCQARSAWRCYTRPVSGGPEEVVSVSELDRRLRRAVEDASVKLWVEGEVSSLKRAPSGHVYFSLKDEAEDAIVECVMYRFNAQRARRHL